MSTTEDTGIVRVFETGRLVGNETFLRSERWSSLLRRPQPVEFPAYSFLLEHPDGLIAIDTGLTARARSPRPLLQRRFVPNPRVGAEIGPRMWEAGVDPADVGRVILTHLDWDHAGGVGHFPNAQALVHHPEWRAATTIAGRQRYEPRLWPNGFAPTVYDLDPRPYGPFPASKVVAVDPLVVIVPLAGHTVGQVGVIVELGDVRALFCADHVLRQDWFVEDYRAGRLLGLGIWNREQAVATSARIARLCAEAPTVLVPSHDDEVPIRLARRVPLTLEPSSATGGSSREPQASL